MSPSGKWALDKPVRGVPAPAGAGPVASNWQAAWAPPSEGPQCPNPKRAVHQPPKPCACHPEILLRPLSFVRLHFGLQKGPCSLCGCATAASWRRIPKWCGEAGGKSSCKLQLLWPSCTVSRAAMAMGLGLGLAAGPL